MASRAKAKGPANVERDIAEMVEYWGRRKIGWLDRAAEEFNALVAPFTYHVLDVTVMEIKTVNCYFTEWFMFERPLRDGKTPLQLYIDRSPDVGRKSLDRLQQVMETQFFARFTIADKDRLAKMATLCDVQTGTSYKVFDPCVCSRKNWSDGVIAQRIACVDGVWQVVGQARLYDVASAQKTMTDGPGAVHPEDAGREPSTADMSLYIRMLRDTIGIDGRYTPTFRLRVVGR